jgi:hypothetical protein
MVEISTTSRWISVSNVIENPDNVMEMLIPCRWIPASYVIQNPGNMTEIIKNL